MRQWLLRQFHPALLSRLGHIIVVQVIFVFAALALIIFFPDRDARVDFGSTSEQHLRPVGQAVERISTEDSVSAVPTLDKKSHLVLNSLFASDEKYDYAAIYLTDDHDGISKAYTYEGDEQDYRSLMGEVDLSWLLDSPIGRSSTQRYLGQWVPVSMGAGHFIYGYHFETASGTPALLVLVIDQEFVVSNRNTLLYGLLLLFLGSILVSLLTVHLIARRFQNPLKRLEQGLEKTASGELFYLLEVDGDTEFNRLVASFNQMSKTLWRNQQTHKKYNQLLKDAYLTQAESQVLLATLIDCSPCSIVAASSEGEIVVFNRMAAEVFGYENGEALGTTIDKLFVASRDAKRSVSPTEQNEKSEEVVCRRKDGSMFPAFLVVSQVSTDSGHPPVHLFIFLDISESRNFQEMMVSVDRYYTRGEMAGDIAHEINNYLAVLSGNIELMPLFLKRGDQEKINKKLELMKTTVDKIARFADGLMDVNQGEAKFVPVDLNQLIQNMLAFLEPQNRFDGIEFVTELSAELPLVELDQNQIQQTLVNLIQNAADALVDSRDPKKIRVCTQRLPRGNCVRVAVIDNGPGVGAEFESSLFEKRFTTKRKGHGYGLVTCRRIIDKHNGRIGYVHDAATEFFFEIPINHQQDSESPAEPTAIDASANV
ncbi:MAG: PAS domain S-box protein [candidate division Zixibacteria bacterium]|nr:PAS domain S-box protein [candidate division Zixibacteria bacterium]